jgi:branched-chain amino acid transport system substrate-binding protein
MDWQRTALQNLLTRFYFLGREGRVLPATPNNSLPFFSPPITAEARMKTIKIRSDLNRRDFLQNAGVFAGAIILSPLLPSKTKNKKVSATHNVGLLVPSAQLYPDLASSFIAGIQLFFDITEGQFVASEINLISEEIGFGELAAREKSTKLLETDGVDVVAGIVSSRVAARLGPLFQQHQIPLIASNLGANVIRPGERTPYLVYNSLNHWRASRTAGTWAANQLGKRGVVCSSLYHNGYDAVHAFGFAFQAAGGEILQTYVHQTPFDQTHLASVITSIRETSPDFVYASFAGHSATDFLQAYAEAGFAREIPLMVSGLMLNEVVLNEAGEAALGVISCLPSTLDPNLLSYKARSRVQQIVGRSADEFTLLGYHTARFIGQVIGNAQSEKPAEVINLCKVVLRKSTVSNTVIGKFDLVSKLDDRIIADRAQQQSGWLNPYLCN